MFFTSRVPTALKASPLGQSLPRKELNRIDELGTTLEIEAGEKIIAKNSIGREVFVVIDGQFGVEGTQFNSAIGTGEVAGELAVLTGNRRNASVTSTASSVVYVMHPREFATLLSDAPRFREHIVQVASDRLGTDTTTLPAQMLPDHERATTSWKMRQSASRLMHPTAWPPN